MKATTIQDDNATKVVVYVNWQDEEILSEAEYEAKLEKETYTAAGNCYDFNRWLNEYYNSADIWDMSEKEKEEVKINWFKSCREDMEYELGYERRVLEIERS